MILAVLWLSPILVPLWVVAAGLLCRRIGRTESARLGWVFFLGVGLLPVGGVFALVGLVTAALVVAAVAALVLVLIVLDWYGAR
ncbi:hypothetical protein AB0E88_07410 [Streptomyces sp. NPDC028635]|uniref:hypothetical protein n=1 Tax=Streptomyces sp. NPDC028635 TaxID=3154800 RepID=UPI0033D0FFBC